MKHFLLCVGVLFAIFNNSCCMQYVVLNREYKEELFSQIKTELPVEVLTSETEKGESGESLLALAVYNGDVNCYEKLNDLISRYEGNEYSFSTVEETIRFKLSRCLLDGLKYENPKSPVYRSAYRFCMAWRMRDLSRFPSPYMF